MTQTNPTILIVDDEEMVATALAGLLELDTPFTVLPFTSPRRALEALRDSPVHVVVSDLMMPEMDGVSFLRSVREVRPTTSRILLTGYADKQNAIRAINEAGLYYYLEKPWSNDHLTMVVRNGVERAMLLQDLETQVSALENVNRELHEMRSRLMRALL